MVEALATGVTDTVFRLAIAAGIGALIGLEREQAISGGSFAGSRTFPLLALLGAITQLLFSGMLPVILGGTTLLLAVAYAGKIWYEQDIGLTTVIAAVLTVLLGAMTTHSGEGMTLAIIVGAVTTVLLSAKESIHGFANSIEVEERRATLKFIVIVLIVLPILPDRSMDALYGLNPRFIWLMVVFVTGISFLAYILSKTLEADHGIALTGLLGGFVSSTATTVSMSERTDASPDLYRICGLSILVAASMMFPRAALEVGVINPALLPEIVVPLAGMTVTGLLAAGFLYWRSGLGEEVSADFENPMRLRPALFFGLIFAAVLLVSESANAIAGASGIYGTAFISGLADVDAMAITLSKLAAEGSISSEVASTGIVIAAASNTIVKAGIAWIIGTRKLGALVTGSLGLVSVVGMALVLL